MAVLIICAILVEGILRKDYAKLFWICLCRSGDVVLKSSYLELWQLSYSEEQNHLCNFTKGHYEEQFCEIIFNLDQWFRRRCC